MQNFDSFKIPKRGESVCPIRCRTRDFITFCGVEAITFVVETDNPHGAPSVEKTSLQIK